MYSYILLSIYFLLVANTYAQVDSIFKIEFESCGHHKQLTISEYLIDDRRFNGASEIKSGWIHFGLNNFLTVIVF